ncbi:hypothetical protein D3C76_1701170 [compost metagenome]
MASAIEFEKGFAVGHQHPDQPALAHALEIADPVRQNRQHQFLHFRFFSGCQFDGRQFGLGLCQGCVEPAQHEHQG